MTILIDSDAFISIESKSDSLHQEATRLLERLGDKEFSFYTSWDVIDEVSTKLSYFLSKEQSLSFLSFIQSTGIHILYPTRERHLKAVQLFSEIATKRVSMTDCMNMVIAAELNLDCIFSFDKIYQQQGFKLLKHCVD